MGLIDNETQELLNKEAASLNSEEGMKIYNERQEAAKNAIETSSNEYGTDIETDPVADNNEPENTENNNESSPALKDEDLITLFNEKTGMSVNSFDELKEFPSQIAKLKEEVEGMKAFIPKSEQHKEMVKALNSNISLDTWQKIQALDFDKMSAKDMVVEKLMTQNELSREEAESIVDAKYKLGDYYDDTENEVKALRTTLEKIDGKEAKKFLQEWKAKASEPEKESQISVQSKQDWEGVAPKIMTKDVATIPFSWEGKTFKHVLSNDEQKAAVASFEAALQYFPDIDPKSDEGKEFVKSALMKQAWADNGPKILNSILMQEKANRIQSKANVTVPANQKTAGGNKLSAEQDLLRRVEAGEVRRR